MGRRLALWALARDYGRRLEYSGPLFRKAAIEGDKVRILFDHAAGGLAARDGKDLTWFEILTPSNAVPAKARIVPASESGLKEDTVLVWADGVPKPVGARFAWHKLAEPNLSNREGLPANSFRTVRAEAAAQGDRLRMVVLTDFIRKERWSDPAAAEKLGVVSIFETLRARGIPDRVGDRRGRGIRRHDYVKASAARRNSGRAGWEARIARDDGIAGAPAVDGEGCGAARRAVDRLRARQYDQLRRGDRQLRRGGCPL